MWRLLKEHLTSKLNPFRTHFFFFTINQNMAAHIFMRGS